ncbi:MAG: hypothetical protein AUH85_05310 [Chloroflexi bacterium 13_1_40CM_4_68_4]|nr:MAG: hypothetical protein AUH85_05310 [Chloroflexi bacterium 13_1_40CM_4_68_4]
MRALLRIAALAVAGATLYYAGLLNSIVLQRPERPGAIAVVLGIAAALIVTALALVGTGRDDARSQPRHPRANRVVWLFICVMATVSVAWLFTVPRRHAEDWTPYHNDAIALNECAAQLLMSGVDPYAALDIFDCYGRLGIGADRTTPLRQGLFADVSVYPTDDQLDAAWAMRSYDGGNVEFVTRPSYPSLSFILLVPLVALGIDTNYLYLACLGAAMGILCRRAPAGLRPFVLTGLLGASCLMAFTIGGSADLLYALPLVIGWMWRERLGGAFAFGAAASIKQIAWFVAPFWLLAVAARLGWRAALRQGLASVAVFALTNLPFALWHPANWLAGVLTPVIAPMFPRGAGLIFVATNGDLALWGPSVYLALEGAALLVCLFIAWRTRHSSPELGIALALVPLFFAWRSLFSYFFLIPLFAFAGLVRMPLGDLTVVAARDAGALTLFALPAKLRTVSRRERAA